MNFEDSPATTSHCVEVVTRLSDLAHEDKPHRHKFCKYFGKVGTTATTVVWIVDKEDVALGDRITFINYDDIRNDIKDFYIKYLSHHTIHDGVIDRINTDGYIFIDQT